MTPLAADRIRKLLGYGLALGITLLLFRVLGRTADGRQALLDPELIALAVLIALSITWVRAARRIRQADLAARRGFPDASGSEARPGNPDKDA